MSEVLLSLIQIWSLIAMWKQFTWLIFHADFLLWTCLDSTGSSSGE